MELFDKLMGIAMMIAAMLCAFDILTVNMQLLGTLGFLAIAHTSNKGIK